MAAEVEIAQRDLRDYADYVLRVDVRLYGDKVAVESRLSRVEDGETVLSLEWEAGDEGVGDP